MALSNPTGGGGGGGTGSSGAGLLNVTEGALRRWRRARARGLAGLEPARVLVLGDSIAAGVGASDIAKGFVGLLEGRLGTDAGGAKGSFRQGTLCTATGTNGVTYVHGANGEMVMAAGGEVKRTGLYGSKVLTVVQGGGDVTVQVKVDGTVVDTFSTGDSGGALVERVTTVTAGTHEVAATVAAGVAYVLGLGMYESDPTTAPTRVYGTGFGGITATSILNLGGSNVPAQWCGWVLPHLTVVEFGTNDYLYQDAPGTWSASLESMVNAAQTWGDVVLLLPGPPQAELGTPLAEYAAAAAAMAKRKGVAVLDLAKRWGTRAQANGLYQDEAHPNDAGHGEMMEGLRLLLNL